MSGTRLSILHQRGYYDGEGLCIDGICMQPRSEPNNQFYLQEVTTSKGYYFTKGLLY